MCLKLYYAHSSPGDLVKNVDFYTACVGWNLRYCLFQKFPGNAHTAGPWVTLGEGRL